MDYMPQFGQNVSQELPQDDTMMQIEMKRRLELAKSLQNQEMPQGQMVSGRYVAPSWTQYLANAVGQYQGRKKEEEAYKQFGEYQKTKAQKQADALKALTGELQGTKQVNQGSYQIQVPGESTPTSPWTSEQGPAKTIDVPMATTTTRAPTSGERYAAIMKYGSAINDPRMVQEAIMGGINQANKAEETAGERTWREQQTKNEQEFQRIQAKERNNQEITMSEKNFLNQMALQKSSQNFQAGENAKSRANQAKAAPSGYQWGANGALMPIPGGPADPNTKPLTTDQGNARLYGKRMTESDKILMGLEAGDKLAYNPLKAKLAITAPAGFSDAISYYNDPQTQSATQAMRDFINATLRRESGAAISASEFDNAIKQYFPQPGEPKELREQKRRNRQIAIEGISAAGYPGGVIPGQQSQSVNFGDLK